MGLYRIKNIFICNKYKMFRISAKTFAENSVYNNIDINKKVWK